MLGGCTAGNSGEASSPAGTTTIGTVTRTSGPMTTITRVVVTSEQPSPSSSARSSVVTSASSVTPTFPTSGEVDGPCPYLDVDNVARLTGQRTGATTVIGSGTPVCVFHRSDGTWLAAVQPAQLPSPDAATTLVDAASPREKSSPASRPDGWTGGYLKLELGSKPWPKAESVYAVSKGNRAVIAWTNQQQTVKSRNIVEDVIAALRW